MCRLREYHIVTLILFIKCLALSCGMRRGVTRGINLYRVIMTKNGRTR